MRRLIKKIFGGNNIKRSVFNKPTIYNNVLVNKIYDFIFGKLPYHVNELLKQKGDLKIIEIYVNRTPINKIIDGLFNILSLGKFDEIKKNLGYDDMFHLFLILKLESGETVKLEKNQDINIMMNPVIEGESIKLNLNGFNKTLSESLDATKNYMGEDKFYKYDSFNNNCQDFVLSFLKANGLEKNNNNIVQFVKQKAGDIIKQMPEYIQTIADTTTDTGSYINRFLSFISRGRIGFKEGGLVNNMDGFQM